MRTALLLIAATIILGARNRCSAQFTFDPPYAVGPNLHSVERTFLLDLNNDGIQELILGSTGSGRVIVLDGGGTGELRPLLDGQLDRRLFHAGDLDGDGRVDIITGRASASGPTGIALYRGLTDGNYASPVIFPFPGQLSDMILADMDGDGTAEIACLRDDQLVVLRWIQTSSSFQVIHQSAATWAQMIALEGEGGFVPSLVLLPFEPDRTLHQWTSAAPDLITPFLEPAADLGYITHADLNADGIPELIGAVGSGPQDTLLTWVLLDGSHVPGATIRLPVASQFHQFTQRTTGENEIWSASGTRVLRALLDDQLAVSGVDTMMTATDDVVFHEVVGNASDGSRTLLLLTEAAQCLRLRETGSGTLLDGPSLLLDWNHSAIGAVARSDVGYGITSNGPDIYDLSPSHGKLNVLPQLNEQGWKRAHLLELPALRATWGAPVIARNDHLLAKDLDMDGRTELYGYRGAVGLGTTQGCWWFLVDSVETSLSAHCVLGPFVGGARVRMTRFFVWDINGDGFADVHGGADLLDNDDVVMSSMNRTFLTEGALFEHSEPEVSNTFARYAIHADLDDDGLEENLRKESTNMVLYRNEGDLIFTPTSSRPIEEDLYGPLANVWADVDGNGTQELIRINAQTTSLSLFTQSVRFDSIGTPVPMYSSSQNGYVDHPRLMDVNGDGDLEIVTYPADDNTDPSLGLTITVWDQEPDGGWMPYPVHSGPDQRAFWLIDPITDLPDLLIAQGAGLYLRKNRSTGAVGLDERTPTALITLFPNPTTGDLTIQFKGAPKVGRTGVIADVTGRTLRTVKILGDNTYVDVSHLGPGIYLMRFPDLVNSELHHSLRFIRQ